MKILLVNEKQNRCQSVPGVFRARQRIIYQSKTEKKENERSPVQRKKKHVPCHGGVYPRVLEEAQQSSDAQCPEGEGTDSA